MASAVPNTLEVPIPRDRDNASFSSGSALTSNESLFQEPRRNGENVPSRPQTLLSQTPGDFHTAMSNEERSPWTPNEELRARNTARAYTEKEKELLSNPLFDHIRQEAIRELASYVADGPIADPAVDSSEYEDSVPESVFKRHHIQDICGFIHFCFTDVCHNNPYRLPPAVFLSMAAMLFASIMIKCSFIVVQLPQFMAPPWPEKYEGLRTYMDTMAGVFPVVITFVLLHFPPLLANF